MDYEYEIKCDHFTASDSQYYQIKKYDLQNCSYAATYGLGTVYSFLKINGTLFLKIRKHLDCWKKKISTLSAPGKAHLKPPSVGRFDGDRQRLSLTMELSIHCYTALALEIRCKLGHLIATYAVIVYNGTMQHFFCL